MSPREKASPFLNKIVPALAIFGVLFVASPVSAAPEPPFVLTFPQEPEPTLFSSTFGAGRSGGRSHTGNDLMAPKMTEVYAAADGLVTVIDTSRLAGRYMEIEHESAWSTRYIHLNNDDPGTDNGSADWSLTVAPGIVVGSLVEAGDLIAYVGDSGNAEWAGSHTHFEMVYEGRALDPYSLLEKAYARAIEARSGVQRHIVVPGASHQMS